VLAIVPIDRGPERFQIVPSGLVTDKSAAVSLTRSPLDVCSTVAAVDICKFLSCPPLENGPGGIEQKLSGLCRCRMACMLVQVGGNYFVDEEFFGGKRTRRREFLGEVSRQGLLRASSIALAAACADFSRSISDDPHIASGTVASLEIQSRRFAGPCHLQLSNISATALSVTRNLPATSVTRKRPFFISVRSDLTVMCPPGKNRSTASFSV
jgi:hypothetical protein